jgi:hypothetical protein
MLATKVADHIGGYRVSSSACANYGALRENDSPLYRIAG